MNDRPVTMLVGDYGVITDQHRTPTPASTGSGFTADSVVDFGPIPCAKFSLDPSGEQIIATAPDGTGIVDVRVTTNLGTSPAVPLGQFAYDGPAPVVVREVSPSSGKVGNQVTITGSGFDAKKKWAVAVRFKETPAGGDHRQQSDRDRRDGTEARTVRAEDGARHRDGRPGHVAYQPA